MHLLVGEHLAHETACRYAFVRILHVKIGFRETYPLMTVTKNLFSDSRSIEMLCGRSQ